MSIFDLRLETERLLLRPPAAEDFDAFAAFCADPQTMQHLGGVQPPSVAWPMPTSTEVAVPAGCNCSCLAATGRRRATRSASSHSIALGPM